MVGLGEAPWWHFGEVIKAEIAPALVGADPLDIAARYQQALSAWLGAIRGIVLEQGIDHHQMSLDEDCEKVLARFLVGRATARGRR